VPENVNPQDLEYMSEVDVALKSKGSPFAFILSIAVMLFFIIFLIWAAIATLDEITRGMGQIIPSQRTQEIQNLEGGILQDMLVREGEIVNENQIMAKLSPDIIQAQVRDAQLKRRDNDIALIRLQAELDDTEPGFPAELAKEAPQSIADQMATFNARRAQFNGERLALESQVEQRKREVEEGLAKKQQLEENLRLTLQRRDTVLPLVEKKIFSKLDYLAIEQQVAGLRGDLNTVAQTISRSRSAVQQAEQALLNRKSELRTAITEEMNKRRSENNSLNESINASGDRLKRTEIFAPVKGTVKRILINTRGGVLKPGETIIELVPLDDALMIEARIKPTDIAFLKPEQKAVVKVSAYDFSIYGGLDAAVEDISADTIEDRRGEPYYLVKLRTTKNSLLSREGKPLPLIPGMTASVDIITGKKTVLAYLLKPITRAWQNAMTER
jgi:adhesin transport system membrane fusion protein